MTILAAMTLSLSLASLFGQSTPVAQPKSTCNIRVVSHKFVGTPGTSFKYDGESYVIPAEGEIELIAGRKADSFETAGRVRPLNVFPVDQFGTETVVFEQAEQAAPQTSELAAR